MPFINSGFSTEGKSFFIFREKEIFLNKDEAPLSHRDFSAIPRAALLDCFEDSVSGAIAAELSPDFKAPDGLRSVPIREFFGKSSAELAGRAARLKAFINWRSITKFCSACSAQLEESTTENARSCPGCKRIFYPRIEPCIITLIYDGDRFLLLRHRHRNQNVYTCLAGFMEAGESAEQAVARETREEVNLSIKNIRYAGSQGWPFPDQLMLAFYAEYESGTIRLQEDEISEARWFPRNSLPPNIPKKGSVAWRLLHNEWPD